jgi:hypothetical protein
MKNESNLLGITIADVTLFDILDDIVMDPILLEFSSIMINQYHFSQIKLMIIIKI